MEDKDPYMSLKDEEEILARISLLKEIKPKEEWVILLRERIFEAEFPKEDILLKGGKVSGILERIRAFMPYLERPAFIMPAFALLISGGVVWHIAKNSLPGDTLYSIKAAAEHVPMTFSSQDQKPFLQLELAQKSLDNLKKVAEGNRVRNLPVAIKEFESNVSEVSKSVAEIVEKQPTRALQAGKGIVELQKGKSEIEKILGAKIGEKESDELDDATKLLVENQLKDLETRLLTERQEELLQAARAAYDQGNYQEALEHIWLSVNQDNSPE